MLALLLTKIRGKLTEKWTEVYVLEDAVQRPVRGAIRQGFEFYRKIDLEVTRGAFGTEGQRELTPTKTIVGAQIGRAHV